MFTIWLMVFTVSSVQFYCLGQQDLQHFTFVLDRQDHIFETTNSLPAITRKKTFDGIFVNAKYVPWAITNITRVDAKHEFSI